MLLGRHEIGGLWLWKEWYVVCFVRRPPRQQIRLHLAVALDGQRVEVPFQVSSEPSGSK